MVPKLKTLRVTLDIEIVDMPGDGECMEADRASGRRCLTFANVTAREAAASLEYLEHLRPQDHDDKNDHYYVYGSTKVVDAKFVETVS